MLDHFSFLRTPEGVENRESFFNRIALIYPKSDPRYIDIERAYNSAKEAFRQITREGGGRYFEHLRAVTLIQIDILRVTDHRLIIAGLLHDIVEDIPDWPLERVCNEFGNKVGRLVDYMTMPPESAFPTNAAREQAYHMRFPLAPRKFWKIKAPDRLHNILTLDVFPEEKRKRKIEETYRYYLPYLERHLILYHEMIYALKHAEGTLS